MLLKLKFGLLQILSKNERDVPKLNNTSLKQCFVPVVSLSYDIMGNMLVCLHKKTTTKSFGFRIKLYLEIEKRLWSFKDFILS